jgi:hypothetical protein
LAKLGGACCCAPASPTGEDVTPDHVNDERPWLNINKLAALSGRPGLELR